MKIKTVIISLNILNSPDNAFINYLILKHGLQFLLLQVMQ